MEMIFGQAYAWAQAGLINYHMIFYSINIMKWFVQRFYAMIIIMSIQIPK